jgi:hypothetical protein
MILLSAFVLHVGEVRIYRVKTLHSLRSAVALIVLHEAKLIVVSLRHLQRAICSKTAPCEILGEKHAVNLVDVTYSPRSELECTPTF